MKFSGIVATYNDGRRLADCLQSLQFCDDLIVIDLGSTDDSVNIAKAYGVRVLFRSRVPTADYIREYAVSVAKYDWVVFLDPDEVFPVEAAAKIKEVINQNSNLGMIELPWHFYFFGHPITYTIWGKPNKTKQVVFHRKHVKFNKEVHHGSQLLEGFKKVALAEENNNFIKHYWVDSFLELFEKHWRYIRLEGQARYKDGERFSFLGSVKQIKRALYMNLFEYKGMSGGWKGIFLSLFYSWYISMSLFSLLLYQIRIKRASKLGGEICA